MSKRTLGMILLLVGLFLFLKNSPYIFDWIPYQDLIWPIGLALFGLYLLSRRNYQVGLVAFYIGVSFGLYYGGWKPIAPFIPSEYYWPTVIMVLGLGFILQSQKGK